MRRGLFVTGTDTGVGKTVVSAALLLRYGQEAPLRYWKPIQTGVPPDDDTAEVRRLAAGAGGEVVDDGIRLPEPAFSAPGRRARRGDDRPGAAGRAPRG